MPLRGGVGEYQSDRGHETYTLVVGDCRDRCSAGTLWEKAAFEPWGDVNVWTLSNDRRWRHWAVQPEFRYWFCDRFSGHFFGLHTHGGQYSIGGFDGRFNLLGTDARKLKDARFQGWFVGGGVAYGYTWILGLHWNLEMEVGFGYSYTRYDRFRCSGCGKKVETNRPHHYVGPTKAAINLVYVF